VAVHNELGKLGEELAASYLVEQGYTILERNWFSHKAEVDIIAQKSDVLVIVEVKTRTNSDYGAPQNFVDQKKIKLLVQAVNKYVTVKNIDLIIRFDIIAVINDATNHKIEHLKDAFYYF
jgi:putative endonuclease